MAERGHGAVDSAEPLDERPGIVFAELTVTERVSDEGVRFYYVDTDDGHGEVLDVGEALKLFAVGQALTVEKWMAE